MTHITEKARRAWHDLSADTFAGAYSDAIADGADHDTAEEIAQDFINAEIPSLEDFVKSPEWLESLANDRA